MSNEQIGDLETPLSSSLGRPAAPPTTGPLPDLPPKKRWFTGTTQLMSLLLLFGVASGALGALIIIRVLPRPAPPTRIGVISMTRLTQVITANTALPGPAASTPAAFRIEGAIKRLTDADPTLVLFVKEAIIAGGPVEDFTDATLAFFIAPSPLAPAPAAGFPAGSVLR